MTEPDRAAAQLAAAAGIPALMEAVRATPQDVEAVKAVWRAFFALPMWLFIARGADDQPSPFVAVLNERPTLMMFSDAVGARAAGMALGLPEAEASKILAIPTVSAADWAASFTAHGVFDIQLDRHLGGFIVSLQMLPGIRANLGAEKHPFGGRPGNWA